MSAFATRVCQFVLVTRVLRLSILPARDYGHKAICQAQGEYARDEDGNGFCEIHVNMIEEFWSLPRPHRGNLQDNLPSCLGFFQLVHSARRRGKALLGALIATLVA